MSRTIYISGASDDLIEVDGDVSLEGNLPSSDTAIVKINGIDALEVTNDDEGLWRITALAEIPGVNIEIFPTPGEDVERDPKPPHRIASYSDYAVLTGDITKVKVPGDKWKA